MKIVTNEQAVLDLILEYWNNPTPIALEDTLKQIQEYYPIAGYSEMGDWTFQLTPQSLIDLSKRYLNQDLKVNNEDYTLLVDFTILSLKILSYEEYRSYIIEAMNKTPIPIATA